MKELTLKFNDFNVFSYLRPGIKSYIEDVIPTNPTFIEIAFNEAVNNAIKHSRNAGDRTITITLRVQKDKRLLIRIKDKGSGFAVNEEMKKLNKAYETIPPDHLLMKESGRGLVIMNQVMDKVIYNQKGNEVLLVKML